MIEYNGMNYNLDFLLQFKALKELLEALAKKQIEYDSMLYGTNIHNQNNQNSIESKDNKINEHQDNDNNKNDVQDDIHSIVETFGLKDGIKKNNDLILSLTNRLEKLEKKTSGITVESMQEIARTEIVKSIDYINNQNKEKFNVVEEKIKELNKKADTIKNNTENFLDLIENNKEELMSLIYKNKKEIQNNKESIDKLKNTLNEFINSKINQIKYNIEEGINKKLEEQNNNINKNFEKNINLINEKITNISTLCKDHEQKIFSIEETHHKTTETFNKKIDSLINFRSEQKNAINKLRSEMTNLKLMYESFNNNIRQINELLESKTFQTLLSDLNNITNKIVDIDEYKKTIDLINNHLKDLQSDNNQYRRYFNDIMPLIKKISTTEDLKKLEELLRELLEQQNSTAEKKYADKSEILKNIKKITGQIKILMDKYNKDKEKGENCMLASKPISEFRCASCENIIPDLKNNTQYLPWNKFPIQDMIIKPYRIGNGFSHFLQNINLEKSSKNLSERSDGENNDNQKNNNINMNHLSMDKANNNKNNLPLVNNNINNIVEIKAHFKMTII
jgi:chromosome segregation ATPase